MRAFAYALSESESAILRIDALALTELTATARKQVPHGVALAP